MVLINQIHPEKLIIIGVTGPLASGCTTIARFLTDLVYEDEKGIQSYLETNEFIKNNEINYDKYEKEIESFYRKRFEIDNEIGLITSNYGKPVADKDTQKLESLKLQAESLHRQLKKVLEDREVIEALDYLTEGEDYKKESRYYISVSDIIIFKFLVDLENDVLADEKQKIEIDEIRKIIKTNLERLNISDQDFKKLYQDLFNFYHHEETNTPPNFDDFKNSMEIVRKVKEELAKMNNYRPIMQDLGDITRSNK